jgi:soluble lytic murein transglycosylase-like protein
MNEQGMRPEVFVVFLVLWLCGSAMDGWGADPGPLVGGPAEVGRRQVVLRDGSAFMVDEIREEADRYIYRMGNMQGFLERGEVAALTAVREAEPGGEASGGAAASPFSTGHRGLDQLIVDTATRYQLDPLLIYLVMREESGFNYRAVSRVGARGLMQLMPATARRLGVRNIHNPSENVEAGTRYLRWLIEIFDGDVNLALAAYNAGEGAVYRYGRRIPPYPETRRYVWRINAAYRRLKGE